MHRSLRHIPVVFLLAIAMLLSLSARAQDRLIAACFRLEWGETRQESVSGKCDVFFECPTVLNCAPGRNFEHRLPQFEQKFEQCRAYTGRWDPILQTCIREGSVSGYSMTVQIPAQKCFGVCPDLQFGWGGEG